MSTTFLYREPELPVVGKWEWSRFSDYEIVDDIVRPTAGAPPSPYDPWKTYHRPGRRRRAHVETKTGGKGRRPRPRQPYDDLLKLAGDMEAWVDDYGGQRIVGGFVASPRQRELLRRWYKDHGPLGLLHHDLREIRTRPVWERSHGESPRLHAVVHGWRQVERSWRYVRRNFPTVVEWDMSREGEPVPEDRYPEFEIARSCRCAAADLLGPKGGIIRQSGSEGIVAEPFDYRWQYFFPTRPEWRSPSWPLPDPASSEFMQAYGEPISMIVEEMHGLRSRLQLIAHRTPKNRPPDRAERAMILQALAGLAEIGGPVNLSVDLNPRGMRVTSFDSPSLYSAYATMLMLDLAGGDHVAMCRKCMTPFVYPDSRVKFCTDQCRRAHEQAEYRKGKQGPRR